MKPENILLLGFVDKAAEYLDKHIDDDSGNAVAELKNIDLHSMKEVLSRNLDVSLGSMQATVQSLMRAGSDAFDAFIENQGDTGALSAELDRLFDLDLKDGTSEDDIAKLMAYYHLPADPDEQENTDDTTKAEDTKITEDTTKTTEPAVANDAEDGQETVFELSDEDAKLLKLISQNVEKVNEGESLQPEASNEEKKLDHIFSQVINHGRHSDNLQLNPGTSLNDPLIEEEKPDPNVPNKNDIVDLVKNMQDSDKYYDDIDVRVENPAPQVNDHFNNSYISEELIARLRKRMIEEDEEKKRREEDFKVISEKIKKVYPYLKSDFIRAVFELKEPIADEYPTGVGIIILHRIAFTEVEHLRQFIEIALNHGYSINADEQKMIVDVFKQHINADGTIITSIFDVANQCVLLQGRYEGYRILYEQKAYE